MKRLFPLILTSIIVAVVSYPLLAAIDYLLQNFWFSRMAAHIIAIVCASVVLGALIAFRKNEEYHKKQLYKNILLGTYTAAISYFSGVFFYFAIVRWFLAANPDLLENLPDSARSADLAVSVTAHMATVPVAFVIANKISEWEKRRRDKVIAALLIFGLPFLLVGVFGVVLYFA